MRLELSDDSYIRDVKVCLELKRKNRNRFYRSFGSIEPEVCCKYPMLGDIQKACIKIADSLAEKCAKVCTTKVVSLEDVWFIEWDKDCYALRYTREKGSGHKSIGYFGKYNLDYCFMCYINWMVNKSDSTTEDEIIDAFNKYYSIVSDTITSHCWEELIKPEAAKPNIPKLRYKGKGNMKIFTTSRKIKK